jgi:TRAP-type mannitol/chloroaromatic compound transport system substrate-binding protein
MESSAPETLGSGHDAGPAALPSGPPDSDLLERNPVTPRRRFVAAAGGVVAAAVASSSIVSAPNVMAQPKVQWRLSTAYPATLDVLHGTAQALAKLVEGMSGGRFRIEVFPGGQIMDPYACFDAASRGTIEAFMASSWTWSAKEPAFSWFGTIPFGMNVEGMTAWCYEGGGLKLWEEAYAAFNLVPRPGPGIAPQMAGWFRKRIGAIRDYKGLKMRIAGLGGSVIARAGGTAVVTPAAEIYPALERGVIDAAEWIGPHEDMQLGLHKTARYYYYPGWQDCGTLIVFGLNKKAYEALPVDLRRTLDHAAAATQVYGLTDYHTKNAIALQRLRTEFKGKVEVLPLPVPVLRDLRELSADVVRQESEKTPMARKVHASYAKFQALVGPWDRVAEGAYHQLVAG